MGHEGRRKGNGFQKQQTGLSFPPSAIILVRGMLAKSKNHNPPRNVWETRRGATGRKDRDGAAQEGRE